MLDDPIRALNELLTSKNFSRQNAERIARVCYDAARLVYERQKKTGKAVLKTKDVTAAIALAETLHTQAFRFVAEGQLAQLFGGTCDEDTAVAYFGEHVLGDVTDVFGRKISIDEDALASLYKDRDTGLHQVAAENYEEGRGKRLPWIRHTLQNSSAVYVNEEPLGRTGGVRRSYLYTAVVTVKLHSQQEQTSYYVVVVREKQETLRMVTAYSMFERNGFLKLIGMSRLHAPQNKGTSGGIQEVVESIKLLDKGAGGC